MIDVKIQKKLACPADKVWELLEDFGNLSWSPGMDNVEVAGEGVGMVRKIIMSEDFQIVERLESMDKAAMSFSYSFPEGCPLPVNNYLGGGKVHADDANSCTLEWFCGGEPNGMEAAEVEEMLKGVYGDLLGSIATHLNA